MNNMKIARVIEQIRKAVKINDELQASFKTGSKEWHRHESIDDALFDALAALGD